MMTEPELLKELAQELCVPLIEDDEVTAQQLADYLGIGYTSAARQLMRKAAAGEMTMRRVKMPDGKFSKAYRKSQ